MDANEVLRRYAAREINFRLANFPGISLIRATLRKVDFAGANLRKSYLRN
ncbi:pentapeptide repeat-containing protein [Calothrix sp. PCC 7507]|nr:pentapeptide repeat-containing protein [Calothrix sp. PCC 7507]AFY35852.1 pentapeptide repeat protein [Calothrix sp. PCC 7507]